MKNKKSTRARRRHSLPRRVRRLLPFPEPPPKLDVNDKRWPTLFTAWCQRKAAWYGMDPIEMMARALGLRKPADEWRENRAEERRKQQQRLEDMSKSNGIYGKSPNAALCHPADGDGGAQKGLSK